MATQGDVTPASHSQVHTLELNNVESTLRRLLLDVAAWIDDAPVSSPAEGQVTLPDQLAREKVVLRFTGGWVRDKLLGVQSHDIDVAINKLTGYQFGLKMKEYLEIPGNPEKYGLKGLAQNDKQSNSAGANGKNKVVGGLHKIEANPEKSKHLETVTTRILGLDIDLVNLRKETYTDESRNPQMEFGTPEEDALRRDATVNAMFYNLNTEEIEDLTGRGHEDMANKIIRTPLEPYQTFKDDPLRVLRLIRFASRLDYAIEPEAEKWMENAEIKAALQAKISRERVGVELEKMLRGPDPLYALTLIDRLGLYQTIFSDPNQNLSKAYKPDLEHWSTLYHVVAEQSKSGAETKDVLLRDAEEVYLAWLLSAFVPYRDAPQPPPAAPGKKLPPPVPTSIARDGIKANNKVMDVITASMHHHQEITSFVQKLKDQQRYPHKQIVGEDPIARDVLGMAIRRWGPTWRSQALFALLVNVADDPLATETHIVDFNAFLGHICKLGIEDAYAMKPLMDGKALAKALGTPPGPWMKDALDVVMAWQLRNPGQSNAEEVVESLRSSRKTQHGELTASLISHFLRLTIRPLFIKNQRRAVTAQGRKVTTTVLPKKFEVEQPDEVAKPWKGKGSHALELLRWVLHNLDDRTVERNWPLLVPPLLSIADDADTRFKAKGCELLSMLLERTPTSLLDRTGLSSVFEDALLSCLGYLPTLTPEDESVTLLSAAYPALVSLSRCVGGQTHTATRNSPDTDPLSPRVTLLDTVVRKGVLNAYTYCNDYPNIMVVLLQNLSSIVGELGIESVKHLKYVLPMISEVLGSPFGHAHPPSLLAALNALQSLILNAWPRMEYNKGEVLKGVTLCWTHINDEHSDDIEKIRKELKVTVLMLRDAIKAQYDIQADYNVLVEADPRLEGLFL